VTLLVSIVGSHTRCLGQREESPRSLGVQSIFKRIVLVLGSVHLTLMAALGIWLWSNTRSFGSTNPCVIEVASISILGVPARLGSHGLRGVSIVFYSLFLAPGFNLIMPMILFLGFFIIHGTQKNDKTQPSSILRTMSALVHRCYPFDPSTWPAIIGLLILLVINVIFVIDIELTLQRNQHLQGSVELQWGFGQILAVLLLVLPLRDLLEAVLARREKQQIIQHREDLQTASLDGSFKAVKQLLEKGADPNTLSEPLCFELEIPSEMSPPVGEHGTALYVASEKGYLGIVQLLLDFNADLTVQGEQFFSSLRTTI
jgi:hypothetical protein